MQLNSKYVLTEILSKNTFVEINSILTWMFPVCKETAAYFK